MRAILITTLLLISVVLIYTAVASGDTGMKRQITGAGGAISDHIRQMSP